MSPQVLGVRRAFIKAGGVDRVLGVLDLCVNRLEADEWPLSGLCVNERMAFGGFLQDEASYGGRATGGRGEDGNASLSRFSMMMFRFLCCGPVSC
jgi:hypothetical protein